MPFKRRICQSALTFPDVVLFFLLSDKDLITIQKVFDPWPLKKRPGERIRLKNKEKHFNLSHALIEVIRDPPSVRKLLSLLNYLLTEWER